MRRRRGNAECDAGQDPPLAGGHVGGDEQSGQLARLDISMGAAAIYPIAGRRPTGIRQAIRRGRTGDPQ